MTITPDHFRRRTAAPHAPRRRAGLCRALPAPPGPAWRFALLRCGAPDTAADTVQEAFMGLLSGRLAFDPLRGSLPNFLLGVVRLLILKHEQPRRRESPLPDPEEDDPELPAAATPSSCMKCTACPAPRLRIDKGAAFIALDSFERIEAEPAPRLVETEVPRTMLAAFGLPATPENAGEAVRAEMLIGAGGEPLALRLSSND